MARADVASINLGGEINGHSSLSPIPSSLPALSVISPTASPSLCLSAPLAQFFFLPFSVSPPFLILIVWVCFCLFEISVPTPLFVSLSKSASVFARSPLPSVSFTPSLCLSFTFPVSFLHAFLCLPEPLHFYLCLSFLFLLVPAFSHFHRYSLIFGATFLAHSCVHVSGAVFLVLSPPITVSVLSCLFVSLLCSESPGR